MRIGSVKPDLKDSSVEKVLPCANVNGHELESEKEKSRRNTNGYPSRCLIIAATSSGEMEDKRLTCRKAPGICEDGLLL